MSSKVHNFNTHFDDYNPIGSNFDHHVVPGYSYAQLTPKQSQQHLQRSKMPGLLRLDSVGEVSSSRLPSDSQMYNTKPILRNCKSADLDNSYKTHRFFSKSNNMTSAKSLTRSHNKFNNGSQHMSAPLLTKSHSFAEESHPQLGNNFGRVAASNSFEFHGNNSSLNKMLSVFSPSKTKDCGMLYRSPWQQQWPSVDTTLLKNMDKHIGTSRKHEEKKSMLSVVAAAFLQPLSSRPVSAESQQVLVSDKNESIPNVVKLSPGVEVNSHNSRENVETSEPLMSSSNATSRVVSDQSDSSVIFDDNFAEETCFPTDNLSLKSNLLQKSLDDGKQRGKRSRNCGALKNDNGKNASLDDTLHNSHKSVVAPSTVLSTPRKAARKGRPSSKKQKKRQREKRKHQSSHSVFPDFLSSSSSTPNVEKEHVSACDNISVQDDSVSSASLKTTNSLLCNSIPRESSPVQTKSKCLIAKLFFTPDLEETDDGDDSDAGSEWSGSEDEESTVYVPPIKCSAFNVALNIDMIFKQKCIPSLKSVLWAEESELESSTQSANDEETQNVTSSTSNGSSCSRDNSGGICVPLAAAALATIGLSNGLSLDSLFAKKPSLYTQAETEVADDTFDVVDGPSTSDANHHLSSSFESCLEAISRINAKWDEHYPTAGFRSCQANSADEITDSNIKVHFAKGAKLKTVHIVGTEDRAGTWQNFVLDRERFQRRILDLEKVISPILEASHRAKVLKQNQ